MEIMCFDITIEIIQTVVRLNKISESYVKYKIYNFWARFLMYPTRTVVF